MENSQSALANLQKTQASQKSLADITNATESQYGVQGARDQVGGLRSAIAGTTNLLKQVAPSIMGRTAGSLVTAAQASKQIQNEQAPLSQTLSEQNQDYNTANTDLSDAITRSNQQAQAQYGDQQNQVSYLQNLYNTLFQREQADEARKQAELDRQEQIRQFNEQLGASRTSSGGPIILGGAPGNGPSQQATSTTPTDPVQQAAFNSVNSLLVKGASDKDLVSDFLATAKSAGYGNAMDKAKIKIYQQKRPDLFLPIGNKYAQYFSKPELKPFSSPAAGVVTGLGQLLKGLF